MSPVSVAAVLSMLALGAKGTTRTELEQLIGEPEANSGRRYNHLSAELAAVADAGHLNLHISNLLSLAAGFTPRPKYRRLLESLYETRVELMEFAKDPAGSVGRINRFVSRHTGGQISRLLAPRDLDALTRLVLVNAFFFKAPWLNQFDPRLTVPGMFHTADGGPQVRARFMTTTIMTWLREDPIFRVRILTLPYSDEDTSMLVILPFAFSNTTALMERLLSGPKGAPFQLEPRGRGAVRREVVVQLPRFKLRCRTDLKRVLPQLGVRSVFDPEAADLTGISAARQSWDQNNTTNIFGK